MDVLVIMLILGLVVAFVTAPLRRRSPDGQLPELAVAEAEPELRELEAARDAKLRELRDAELDHRTGKLSDEDYHAVDAALRAEAIEILRSLDQAREGLGDTEVHAADQGLLNGDGQSGSAADTIND